MKFLVDAHLPPGLCGLLQAAGHDARHTHQLPICWVLNGNFRGWFQKWVCPNEPKERVSIEG